MQSHPDFQSISPDPSPKYPIRSVACRPSSSLLICCYQSSFIGYEGLTQKYKYKVISRRIHKNMTIVTAFGPGRKESGELFSTVTPLGHWSICHKHVLDLYGVRTRVCFIPSSLRCFFPDCLLSGRVYAMTHEDGVGANTWPPAPMPPHKGCRWIVVKALVTRVWIRSQTRPQSLAMEGKEK